MLVAVRPGHGVAAATAGASAVKFGELPRLILQLREAHQEAGESIAGLPVYVRARPALRAAAEDHGQDVASRRQVDRCKAGHGSNAVIGWCDAPRRYQDGSQLRRCLKLASPWPTEGKRHSRKIWSYANRPSKANPPPTYGRAMRCRWILPRARWRPARLTLQQVPRADRRKTRLRPLRALSEATRSAS